MNVHKFHPSDVVSPSKKVRGPRRLPDYLPSRSQLRGASQRVPDSDEGANLWSPGGSDCSSSDENNSPSALNSFDWDKPAMCDKRVDFEWSDAAVTQEESVEAKSSKFGLKQDSKRTLSSSYVNLQARRKSSKKFDVSMVDLPTSSSIESEETSQKLEKPNCRFVRTEKGDDSSECLHYFKDKAPTDSSSESSDTGSYPNQRNESTLSRLQEEEDLMKAAWFQAGIPREIALEVLSGQAEGSFIVRESTTKPGCFALSLRVPPGRNDTGIAHYLILRTNKGYKIKGFTKEFGTLSALITHHSVMPELLPCPLSLSRTSNRDAEKEFEETEQKPCDLFTDIHWLMDDLQV